MRTNPHDKKVAPRPIQKIEISDPDEPGRVYTFHLRKLGYLERSKAGDRFDALITKYVTGENGEPPLILTFDGRPVTVSERLFDMIASIECMQFPDDPADFFSAEDLVALAAGSEAVMDILVAKAGTINRGDLGNACEGVAATASAPPSSTATSTQT